MSAILRVMAASSVMMTFVMLGCKSQPRVAARSSLAMTAPGYGTSPSLVDVRITSTDGLYDYLYTLRREIAQSEAYPFGAQLLDLGQGNGGGSKIRLQMEKGFVVVGGCFPVYAPIPDGASSLVLPRPWPVVASTNAAISAQGTKFSLYLETDSGGTVQNQYVFKHSGGPVEAWLYTPGTDPSQSTSTIVQIPASTPTAKYILVTYSGSAWTMTLNDLPTNTADPVRKYFDACDAVATNVKIPFPSCVIPE